mgnify:CR=1 FL=1
MVELMRNVIDINIHSSARSVHGDTLQTIQHMKQENDNQRDTIDLLTSSPEKQLPKPRSISM